MARFIKKFPIHEYHDLAKEIQEHWPELYDREYSFPVYISPLGDLYDFTEGYMRVFVAKKKEI